ncbi:hypothetical protein HZ994_09815 [Akkermansiaceae bacterium]|nr:hypothetical protein HZ994_09815 [Akkermansiaceae bacterium]
MNLNHPAIRKTPALFLGALSLFAMQIRAEPLKVFILAGQSNMLGQGNVSPAGTKGTLEYTVANEPATYGFVGTGAGNWVVRSDVRIKNEGAAAAGLSVGFGSSATTIGPEVGFGHRMGDLYENRILIVKASWGGKDLAVDFRPPSSGGTTGFYYTAVLNAVNDAIANLPAYVPGYDPADGYEIAGFGWHQGWNDRVDAGKSAQYQVNMANFIRDMRTALGVPGLPFVIATSAMDGNGPETYSQVELAQRAMTNPYLTNPNPPDLYPDFVGSVSVVDCRSTYDGMKFWFPVEESPIDQGFHWNRNAKTYLNIGLAMADAMSSLAPGRCPSRLRAEGAPGGINLTWQNGLDTPSSVRILRNSVEIAAAAPASPAAFLDTTALPGIHDYEFIFTMPGDPCDPLSVAFDGGIANLAAFRSPGGIGLTWENTMPYSGIELRRNGTLLEASLPGSSTSYTDASPPASGLVTYSVVPTTGTASRTTTQINLAGPPTGNALVYEPFDYVIGGLNLRSGDSEVGLDGAWNANSLTPVTAGSLSFGALPVGGGKLSAFSAAQNRFGGSRPIRASALAENGFLNDGATVWFSFLAGLEEGTNRTNTRLAVALAAGPFGTGNADFFITGGTGVGVSISAGIPRAASFPAGSGSPVTASNNSPQSQVGQHGLIVGKITWGATAGAADTIQLYAPGTDLALPATPISTLSTTVDQSTFDTLTFRRGDKPILDEIRFGASYDDVIGAGNTPPTISAIVDQTIPSGGSTSALAFTVGGGESGPLTLSASSSNNTLVPGGNISLGGSGANRTVTVTPVSGFSGSSTITITADNGTATATQSFILTVTENFLSWATANSVSGGANDDSNGNGVKNLIEYALADGAAHGLLDGDTLTFTKRSAPFGADLTYAIEISSDLGTGDEWTVAETGVTQDAASISITFTPGSPQRRFARLKVLQNP